MKAVVYNRPKHVSVEDVPDPEIRHPRDAILRVTSTAICGSDLHIYNGLLPQLRSMILGHEFMGVVEEVGEEVTNLKKGDRVVVPFPIADGTCWFCTHGMPTHCENSNKLYGPEGKMLKDKGTALFGYTDLYGGYDGGQAEKVRVPFADFGPRKVPDALTDEQALFLTDIAPTGYCAVDWGGVQAGETVAVFGAGPVGIMALKMLKMRGARGIAVEPLEYRRKAAVAAGGAEFTIDPNATDVGKALRAVTEGRGPDVCIDAVGMEAERNLVEKASAVVHLQRGTMKVLREAMTAVRRGGRVSVVGIYGTPFDNFRLDQLIDKGLTVRGGQATVHTVIDEIMGHVVAGRLRLDDIITHTLPLEEAAHGYEVFNAKKEDCLKVVLKP